MQVLDFLTVIQPRNPAFTGSQYTGHRVVVIAFMNRQVVYDLVGPPPPPRDFYVWQFFAIQFNLEVALFFSIPTHAEVPGQNWLIHCS
jgi:hypothetical protein